MMKKRIYTVKDVASLIFRDIETVRVYCRDGRLKANKVGGGYLITDASLKAFLGDEIYAGVIDTLPSLPASEQEGMGYD